MPRNDIISVRNFSFSYGETEVLHGVDMDIPENQVTALIGPSGCGKTTLLRSMNRMNDLIADIRHEGDVLLGGQSLYESEIEVSSLRKRIGMVFQRSNPFAKSIYENVAFSLRLSGRNRKKKIDEVVERSLVEVALWDEVKDRLNDSALTLSGGQQQRLCIARAIANQPEVLLMDEPCSSLDPTAALRIEDLIWHLKEQFSIVIVTHNLEQAARCSDLTAFLFMGSLVEYAPTRKMFENPDQEQTEAYISGRFS